jgi:hypothetical protein
MSDKLTPSGSERRVSVRYPSSDEYARLVNSCRALNAPQDETWEAHVRDFSTTGIGLRVDRRFEPDTLLMVDLHDLPEGTPDHTRTLLVRVARVTPHDDGTWILGCSLMHKLTEADLLALL